MKWNDSFAIGIDAIDDQHKKIFEHLLAIENSVAKRDPWHILRFLISQLADYMKFHLAVEEAFLEVIRYPGRSDHCDSHKSLMVQIAELEDGLRQNGSAENLVSFFENWFVRHVLIGDRKYAAYVKEQFPALLSRQPA
jgi:hemerythrin